MKISKRDRWSLALGAFITGLILVVGCSAMDKGHPGSDFWTKRATEMIKDEQEEG